MGKPLTHTCSMPMLSATRRGAPDGRSFVLRTVPPRQLQDRKRPNLQWIQLPHVRDPEGPALVLAVRSAPNCKFHIYWFKVIAAFWIMGAQRASSARSWVVNSSGVELNG